MYRLCLILCVVTLGTISASGEMLLPDGTEFALWRNTTVYSTVYHVNNLHPAASDSGPGTETRPFRTISKAAAVLQPGQQVIIHQGVYREFVQPLRGGTGPSSMISFVAAAGDSPIITGSRVYTGAWTSAGNGTWSTTLPAQLFATGYNPFAIPNLTEAEANTNPWTLPVYNTWPYNAKRGMIWQDGRRLVQVRVRDSLTVAGRYWVAADGYTVVIRPYSNADPNRCLMEVSVQEQLFMPSAFDYGYIEIKGLTFQHAANSFKRINGAAVCANGGHHWIIEGNTFREINSAALDFGWEVREWMDNYPYGRVYQGSSIVRNNTFYACGTAGIRSMEVPSALVESNHLYDIGWWRAEETWETAAIKLLVSSNSLVRFNVIHNTIQAQAIWMDWHHQNSRVTRNVCFDIEANVHGAILSEGTTAALWIDHNFIWNVTGHGIVQVDGANMLVAHNFVGQTTKPGFNNWSNPGREGDGQNNTIVNNVFYNCTVAFGVTQPNRSDNNVFIGWGKPTNSIHDLNSVQVAGNVSFTPVFTSCLLNLTWSSTAVIPSFPSVAAVSHSDYFCRARSAGNVPAGLFEYPSPNPSTVNLWPACGSIVSAIPVWPSLRRHYSATFSTHPMLTLRGQSSPQGYSAVWQVMIPAEGRPRVTGPSHMHMH